MNNNKMSQLKSVFTLHRSQLLDSSLSEFAWTVRLTWTIKITIMKKTILNPIITEKEEKYILLIKVAQKIPSECWESKKKTTNIIFPRLKKFI